MSHMLWIRLCSCHADFSALEKLRRTLLIYLYVNAAFWMMNTGIYDSWVSRYALYVCVICFYASGYKEKFPHRDNKDELKSRGSERRKEQQLWAFGFLLRVPSGVFTVNKQRSGFRTETRCAHPSRRTNVLNALTKPLKRRFYVIKSWKF